MGDAYVDLDEKQLETARKNLVEMDDELLEHIYLSEKPVTEDVHHILQACLILLGYPKKTAGVRRELSCSYYRYVYFRVIEYELRM